MDMRQRRERRIQNMSRISRLFKLINVLRARRTPVTALYLARELGISRRSVYRDIETLRSLGAPLDGQAGIGFCLREDFFLPEFAFSSDELDVLILGLAKNRQRQLTVLCAQSCCGRPLCLLGVWLHCKRMRPQRRRSLRQLALLC